MVAFLVLGAFIGVFFLMRLFGAWMFRINDVIKNQKETNELLKTIANK
jgi:hypothetical protein